MATPKSPHPVAADNLLLAVVASSEAPLLLLDGALTVVAASESFCRSFEIDPTAVTGRSIFGLGSGEWDVRQLRSLLKAASSGQADPITYEMDLVADRREPRQVVINARRLEFGDVHNVRLLVTVSDVTEARLAEKIKDTLLREKVILQREIQRRVANSLQIVASILLQGARKVQSEEARGHLRDAHYRIMSIGVVQQHLSASEGDEVELLPYFTELCESLGASMIGSPEQLSIEVSADHSAVDGDISISLGLIVTELVINALKHAFPGGRHGKIMVGYQSHGPNWTLSVGDNGVGMPKDVARAMPGLGSSIIEALARQLHARILVVDAKPGTEVSVVHNQIAAVKNEASAAAV
jgi:two-component sensor histidine kinase